MEIKKLVIKTGTTCSLRCEKCGEFNPYLEDAGKSFILSAETLSKDVFRVLSAVDKIETVHIAGGEPFLRNDLFQLVAFLYCSPKIENIEIVTNGTVIPDEIVLSTLRWVGKKTMILVSDYSTAGIDNDKFLKLLDEASIRYRLLKDMVWKDKSDMTYKNVCEAGLLEIAEKCTTFRQNYFTLINGIITPHCPTSGSVLHYMSLHEKAETFFVNVRDCNDGELKSALLKLNDNKFTPMCNWCVPTYKAPDCLAGAQIK